MVRRAVREATTSALVQMAATGKHPSSAKVVVSRSRFIIGTGQEAGNGDGKRRQSAGGGREETNLRDVSRPLRDQRVPRNIVNGSVPKGRVFGIRQKVRASADGFPDRKEKVGQHVRTVFIRRGCLHSTAGLLPVRRRTGSRPLRRGFFVVRSINVRCPFRLRSKKDRLLGHGFVRTGDSRSQ